MNTNDDILRGTDKTGIILSNRMCSPKETRDENAQAFDSKSGFNMCQSAGEGTVTAPPALKKKGGVVYVLDDDESVRLGISRLLRSVYLDVRTYGAADEFLEEVRNTKNACILLDLTMPDMSGSKVMAALKEKGINLPVIVLSAREEEAFRQDARELGAQLFLRKPVDDRALFDAIDWAMGNSSSLKRGGADDEQRR
jgi:CheY-like chemotaxis protein